MNNVQFCSVLCGMAFLLLAAVTDTHAAPAPPTVTVGDPANPGALAQELQDAYKNGARRIVIKRGEYLLPDVGHPALVLDGWQDATVSGYGVTLITADLAWGHSVFEMQNCTHVTLEGPTLSQTEVTSTQGRVIDVGKDAAGKPYCDWRSDAGYPVPSATDKSFMGGSFNVVDAHTHLLKTGNGDFYNTAFEALPDNVFRVHAGGNFGVGDWLVGRYGNAPFKVHVVNCHNCTIQNITMMRNGFAPIREENGGGNRYLHCIWALGPRPKGATEDSLVTNAADGMHMTGSNPGPDIENCQFQGVFLDDCIAIHGYLVAVTGVAGSTLTLEKNVGLQVGQPVRISSDKGFFGQALVTALKDNGNGTWAATLDKDLSVPVGAKLSNPLGDGAGYKIIGCHLGCTRSRGILVKADNGLIKNNVLENCGMSAVSIGPEYYWNEADYAHNVTVEGNTFRENGRAAYGGACIFVHGDGAMGNQNIVIRNNRFTSNYQGDMDIAWVSGVTISDNVMAGVPSLPAGMKRQSPIALSHSADVTLSGNIVKRASDYNPALLSAGDAVTNLTGNDHEGIHAVSSS